MQATVVSGYPKIANHPGGQRLRRAIAQFDEGRLSQAQLDQVADEVTREVIEEQVAAGLDLITDGLIRWQDDFSYIARGLEGLRTTGLLRYFDTNTYFRQPVTTGTVRWTGPISVRDWRFAAEVSPKPVKALLPGPYTFAKLSRSEHHASLRDFTLTLASALNQEARALQEAGAPLVQFNEPAITKHAEDWPLFQEAAAAVTQGLTVKTAVYTWFGDVAALDGFFDLPFNVFGLDFVMGPANWGVLSAIPADRELGLGIVDARNVKLETVEEIARAIERATAHVSPDRLWVGPSASLEYLPREQAQAKLARLVEGVHSLQAAYT